MQKVRMAVLFVSLVYLVHIICCNPIPRDSPIAPYVAFSWETVPVFYHSDNYTGQYSDEAIKILSKFPIVTFEKYQGPNDGYQGLPPPGHSEYNQLNYTCCAEDRILFEAKRIKLIDPNTTIIMYFNTALDFPHYRLHQSFVNRSDLWLKNKNGEYIFRSGDGHGQQDMIVYDFTQTDAVNMYSEACINATKSPYIDGCFHDRIGEWGNTGYNWTDDLPSNDLNSSMYQEYSFAHGSLGNHGVIQKIQNATGHSIQICNHAFNVSGVNAAQLESFWADEMAIDYIRWAAANGKLIEAHVQHDRCFNGTNNGKTCRICGGCPDCVSCGNQDGAFCSSDFNATACTGDITNTLSAFLIGAGYHSYYGCGVWHNNMSDITEFEEYVWHPDYDKALGKPLSDGYKIKDTWYRTFSHGTNVTFNTTTNTGTIQWGSFDVNVAHFTT